MIIIVIRIDATQISFRTGQLSLFEKKRKYFPFSPLTLTPPPPPPSFLHPRSTPTRAICYLTAVYCLGWEQKWPVTEANPFSSVLRLHKSASRWYRRICSHICQGSITSSLGVVNSKKCPSTRGTKTFLNSSIPLWSIRTFLKSLKSNERWFNLLLKDDATWRMHIPSYQVVLFRIHTLLLLFHQTHQPVVYVYPPLDSTMRYS